MLYPCALWPDGAERSSGQRVGLGLFWSGSGPGLVCMPVMAGQSLSRFIGTEAIMIKDVVMSGRIASEMILMAQGHVWSKAWSQDIRSGRNGTKAFLVEVLSQARAISTD